tara:strand:+ start:367 stop:915 length:549 start_codon:yes stop_codon:yes gene_type:complete
MNLTTASIKNILSKWGFSRRGLISNYKGEWYLFSQILLILLHLLPPYLRIVNISYPIKIFFWFIGTFIIIQGFKITIKAFKDLGDNITPLPTPMKESSLIKTNSYQTSRHPIYKGLLLISLGFFVFSLSLIHLSLFILLAYLLKHKALIEERNLKIKFPEYKQYMTVTPAIIKDINLLDWRK